MAFPFPLKHVPAFVFDLRIGRPFMLVVAGI
jgi:hypothetical protein